jgi:hypothetical protein
LQVRHWVLVGGVAGLALVVGWPGVGGVALGGGVIGVSVPIYAAGLRLLVRPGRRRLAIGLLFAKLSILLALGWLAFAAGARRYRPNPIGFALGLTCFPVAAVWEALRRQR